MNTIKILYKLGLNPIKNGVSYSSGCPFCGGKTRLVVWPEQGKGGRYLCRKCGETGDAANLLNKKLGVLCWL